MLDITWMDMDRPLREFVDSWTSHATTCTPILNMIPRRGDRAMYFLLDRDGNRIAPIYTIDATYSGLGEHSITATCGNFSMFYPAPRCDIEKVIFNAPATIVLWKDGTKTVVKCQDGDEYSKETGLALCIVKKAYGNKGNYNNIFRKWVEE